LLERVLGEAEDATSPDAIRAALEEYAVECSIAKVLASEELGQVVDELVQIHGGYGYIEEYPAAGFYRDARIHRIWEGTNEINRLLIPGTLLFPSRFTSPSVSSALHGRRLEHLHLGAAALVVNTAPARLRLQVGRSRWVAGGGRR